MVIKDLQKHQSFQTIQTINLRLGEPASVTFGLGSGVEFHMPVFEQQYDDCVCCVTIIYFYNKVAILIADVLGRFI